ncbi:uncharacterized protein VTP21DRAFT_1654 [Calcarisporiella thermophila]|uniref:uncharacterized protein n=1 Tax=Calcarisporiella thermophila TaxID=911321 RepID=UPI0037426BB2
MASLHGLVKNRAVLAPLLTELPKPKYHLHINHAKHSEATLYLRGFMSDQIGPSNFSMWTESHHRLVASDRHRWGDTALGYTWPAGKPTLNYIIPLTVLCWVANQMKLGFPSPTFLLTSIALDISLHVLKLSYYYRIASENSSRFSDRLAEELLRLRERYSHLRVVSHSLGCHHLLAALSKIPSHSRPCVVHLLGAAVREQEFAPVFASGVAQRASYLYYTPRDRTLAVVFRWMFAGGGPAAGEVGCQGKYRRLFNVDVTRRLGNVVHTGYAKQFWSLAEPL